MIITYRQTGGIAGIRKGCKLKLAELAAPDQTDLQQIVRQSGILAEKSKTDLNNLARDAFRYEITVEDDGKQVQVIVDDTTLTPTLRPLVDFLRTRATPEKRAPKK